MGQRQGSGTGIENPSLMLIIVFSLFYQEHNQGYIHYFTSLFTMPARLRLWLTGQGSLRDVGTMGQRQGSGTGIENLSLMLIIVFSLFYQEHNQGYIHYFTSLFTMSARLRLWLNGDFSNLQLFDKNQICRILFTALPVP
jgi:hypothetical protein